MNILLITAMLASLAIVSTYLGLALGWSARLFHWANAVCCVPIIALNISVGAYPSALLSFFFGAVGVVALTTGVDE